MVVVVKGDGIILNGDTSVDPSAVIQTETQGGFGGGIGSNVDGGQGSFSSVDEQFDGYLLGIA